MAVRAAGPAGTIGESVLEDILQFGGLVAGQLPAGHFAGDQAVDFRFHGIRRRPGAGGLVAGAAGLQRAIDVRERRGQGVLVARIDLACGYFRLELFLEQLQRRGVTRAAGGGDRGHGWLLGCLQEALTLRLMILTRPCCRPPELLSRVSGWTSETHRNKYSRF